MEAKSYCFNMYLYNKNIFEYAQILEGSGRFMIFHIEGHSTIYIFTIFYTHSTRVFKVIQPKGAVI